MDAKSQNLLRILSSATLAAFSSSILLTAALAHATLA